MAKQLTSRQQIIRIKQIVRKDADGTHHLIGKDGTMCVLGGLAFYGCGVSKKRLRTLGNEDAFDRIARRFPVLSGMTAHEIFSVNDSYDTLSDRRRALCKLFDGVLRDVKIAEKG